MSLKEKKVIMVFDVPAVSGGALSILKYYHDKALKAANENEQYIFVVSTPQLSENKYVKVMNFPWVKKSWFKRLKFDYRVAPKLVKQYNVTEIFSLQNLIIKKINVPQTIYVHQPLPFCEYKYNFFKNPKMWVIQNIIGSMIKKSIKKADKIIVQTNWMKDACIKTTDISADKITIQAPQMEILSHIKYIESEANKKNFFFPAAPIDYKNHKVIVKAVKYLKDKGINDIKIIFTCTGNENRAIKKLFKYSQKYNLNITFAGSMHYDNVLKEYQHSTLIFPSKIETFGLPMLEARLTGSPIIAAETLFAKEILKNYEKAEFFPADNFEYLAQIIRKSL